MSGDGGDADVKGEFVEKINTVERPSSDLLQRWIQKQADLLIEERKVEKEEARLLLSKCSPKQLERNGLAILGLGVLSVSAGLGGKTLVELERPAAFHNSPIFPPHSFRPGDIVQIEEHGNANESTSKNTSKATALNPVPGVVFRVLDTKIIVAASTGKRKDDASELSDLPSRLRVVKVANEATFDRMEWALTRLARQLNVSIKTSRQARDDESSADDGDEVSSSRAATTDQPSSSASTLVSTLLGLQAPKWHSWPQGDETLTLHNENLNSSQIAALKFALGAKHFALIHGPPGTGKTTAVAEMVLQMAITKQQRVLVCGASNLAADNLMERILSKGGDALKRAHIGISRIGHPARVLPSLVRSTLDFQAQHSSEGALLKDVQSELDAALTSLRPAKEAAGNKSTSWRGQASAKSQKIRGSERKERREEIKALRKEYRKRSRLLMRTVLQRASIVVSTCHGAGGKQLDGMEFDAIVIDEACQATEASCWVPLVRAKPDGVLILAGDHLQLPPTVKGFRHSRTKTSLGKFGKEDVKQTNDERGDVETDSDEERFQRPKVSRTTCLRPPRSLETTMFSRLLGMYGSGCKALLDTQYRMNTEIMAFPNKALYQNEIKADESCKSIRLQDIAGYEVNVTEDDEEETDRAPIVFYDTAGCEMYETQQLAEDKEGDKPLRISQLDSRANAHEVELVAQHVELLLRKGLEPNRISVLSPYNLQVSALADRLRGGGNTQTTSRSSEIVVGSIDSMQGMENDVVIISLVRSNDQRSVGFLAEKRRLNVAMTRPKRQLCVIGDSETIGGAGDAYLRAWMDFLERNAFIEPVIV